MQSGVQMYEAKWHRYTKPDQMIAYLRNSGASPRKLRLFACACFRCVWDETLDPLLPGVAAVLVAERFAEAKAGIAELLAAYLAAKNCTGQEAAEKSAGWAADQSASSARYAAGRRVSRGASRRGSGPATSVENWLYCAPAAIDSESTEAMDQTKILRDIFNPFRPIELDPAWLSANGGAVAQLARQVYDRGEFNRLPALADALEAAGCANEDLLKHCRADCPHVRGCWAIDLLLGFE